MRLVFISQGLLFLIILSEASGSMRAPFCNDSTDSCPDDKGIICSANETEREIHSLERSLVKSQGSKAAVFGISLDDLMGTTTQVTPRIPFILSRLCRYIETHGLFFKNLFTEGDEKIVVENLKVEFTECGDASLEKINDIASAARLLMLFFEDLPEPLIPASTQSDFIKDMEKLSLGSEDCISHLKQNVRRIPDSAYEVLKYLSRFLLRVACHEEYNGMSFDSLAVLFSPLIFRSSSKDPFIHLQLKDIVNCFIQDYHEIFEDDINSPLYEDVRKSSSTKVCRQLPCRSSVMPVLSLSPLSVVIPSMDTNSSDNNPIDTVPALLIEGQMDASAKKGEKIPFFPGKRKRKERRYSGEDSQPRSSSEERPNSLLSIEKMEIIRRCNSHEEMVEDMKINDEEDVPRNAMDKGDTSHHVDTYLSQTMELVVNEKNHSPHPPNAKRREVDTTETNGELPEHTSWKYTSSPRKLVSSDLPHCRDSKQNPIAEFSDKNTMECDTTDEQVDAEKEFLESKSGIPRSASCPVPKVENEKDNSDSESSSLSLSWSMLFEDSEPIRSAQPLTWSRDTRDEALLSPSVHELRSTNYYEAPLSPSAYRSYLSHRSSHLDPNVPPSPPVEQEDFAKKLVEGSGISDSIKQLTKKIHGIKRKIKKFDEKFEAEFGYKPSHAEKSNNSEAKKLLNDLYRARKELKVLKEEAHLESVSSATSTWHANQRIHILGDTTNHFLKNIRDKSKPSIEDSLEVTLKTLSDERATANRPELIDDMTTDQVRDEKVAIQKALLHLESIHGKPYTKGERESIRPLYDRYRSIKKIVRSSSFPGSLLKKKELCGELQPILEHETMDFPSRDTRAEKKTEPEKKEEKPKIEESEEEELVEQLIPADDKKSTLNSGFLTMKYDNSNFHELPLSEMIFQLQKVKSEKRHLRKILKEFETEFMRLNGRKVQKEDKAPVETVYSEYKHVKARLKLLEALISKHDQHQLM
ncbi:protein FAM13A [Trichonephila inaurata madagascariensis]|uniref:Protein FAM13A n=1 Tax=Trichonephila inaurata madagascariensis TaxID=2747483 RepID=A0A8X6YAJ5_9ARAC|nr:protein FAM13A [Trichonephila inaurata madagascariensis]